MNSNVVRIDNTEFKVDKGVARPPIAYRAGKASILRRAVSQMEVGDSMFVEGHTKEAERQAGKISYSLSIQEMSGSVRKVSQDPVTGLAGYRVWRVG